MQAVKQEPLDVAIKKEPTDHDVVIKQERVTNEFPATFKFENMPYLSPKREPKQEQPNDDTSDECDDMSDDSEHTSDDTSDEGDDIEGDTSIDEDSGDVNVGEQATAKTRANCPKLHPCSKCEYKGQFVDVQAHYRLTHRIGTSFKCDCGKSFGSQGILQKHRWKEHISEKFCDSCDFRCNGRNKMRRHKEQSHNVVIVCNVCMLQCNSRGEMQHHKRHMHKPVLVCNICMFQCNSRGEMRIHKKQLHTKPACHLCGFIANSIEDLKFHTNMNHFVCNICGFTSPSSLGLKLHIGKTHAQKSFFSTHCERMYLTQTGLIQHQQKKHPQLFEFHCNTCAQCFDSHARLQQHDRVMHLLKRKR